MTARVDRTVTSGTFTLDGETFDVDNNVWVVGDDEECVVIDPAHDAQAVEAVVDGRRVLAILCTHGHDDHVAAAPALSAATGAPVLLHADDEVLWRMAHPGTDVDRYLDDGDRIDVAGTTLEVLHTPGHAPGAVCLHAPDLGVVFSGDTLFAGGPGATGRSYSDYPTIVASIRDRLLTLPPETEVRTGHGESTTIGAEAPHLQEWLEKIR